MRNERDNNRRNYESDREPRRLHELDHGENSRRGNYSIDSHFNRGYGRYDDDFRNETNYRNKFDQGTPQRQDEFQGRNYGSRRENSAPDYNSDNPYGMNYTREDGYNSGRHYYSRANYNYNQYDDEMRSANRQRNMDEHYTDHSSRGEHESYGRYEKGDRIYHHPERREEDRRNY